MTVTKKLIDVRRITSSEDIDAAAAELAELTSLTLFVEGDGLASLGDGIS